MAKTDASYIKDLIGEVERPFIANATAKTEGTGVYDRMSTIADIMFTRYNYAQHLSPLLTNKITVPADLLRHYLNETKASLRDDLSLHLDPVGDKKREETSCDKVEVMEAYTLLRLDPDGFVRDAIRYYQAGGGLYFTGWLEEREYIQPERAKGEAEGDYNKRVEQYRKSWFPWVLSVKNPHTVAYMERDRVITTGTLRLKIPVIEALERYGKSYEVKRENPEHALLVFNEHFGFLRAGDDQSDWDQRALYAKEIEVCVCADAQTISHYFETGEGEKTYEGMGQTDFDNPFGEVPLLLAEGVYNPFEPLPYRRECLLMTVIKIEHGRAQIKSAWASKAASPPTPYEKLPEALSALVFGNELPPALSAGVLLGPDGRPLIPRAAGEIMGLDNEIEAHNEKLFDVWGAELEKAAPRGVTSNLDPESDIAVSLAVMDIDERNRLLAEAKKSEVNLWDRALNMIKHSRIKGMNGHRTTGEPKRPSDWSMSFTTTGKEWPVKGKVIERGQTFEITPQDLDIEMIRTIEPVDNRASAVDARARSAERRRANGTILWDDFVEQNGVENVTEFNEKKLEEMLFQTEIPAAIMDIRMKVGEMAALMHGTTIEEELGVLPEEMMPQVAQAFGAPAGGPTTQVASPATEGIVGDTSSVAMA